MKYFQEFQYNVDESDVKREVEAIISGSKPDYTKERLGQLFSMLDITTLSEQDNSERIGILCDKINMLSDSYPELPSPAALCIYPELVAIVKSKLNNPMVNIASVGGGFPASQTFIEVKKQEIEMAIEEGAEEIDIVLSIGKFQIGLYEEVFNELKQIKNIMGPLHLKVILETGSQHSLSEVRKASMLAMDAGADFIKTSTGKAGTGADLNSFHVMCNAIKDFYEKSGRKTGIKPAGGISTVSNAFEYMAIVENVLGATWIDSEYFRIGASKLANAVIRSFFKKDDNFSYFN